MKIQAYKCRFTGKVFEESKKKEYIKHLKQVRHEMREKRKDKEVRSTFHNWLITERAKPRTVLEIADWFMDNQRTLMDAHNAGIESKHCFSWSDEKFVREDVFVDVKISLRSKFSLSVSNTHQCPDNGVTNWGSKPNLPTGYPGWSIDVRGTLKRPKKYNSSYPYTYALNLAGIKTGSGGGGNDHWGYDAIIFLADWPGLQEQLTQDEMEEVVHRLKTGRPSGR